MAILAGGIVDAGDLAAIGVAWQAYTPSFINVSGTPSGGTYAYAVVGKTMFLRGEFPSGCTATAAAVVGVSLPSGVTVTANQAISGLQTRTVRTALVNASTDRVELTNSDGTNFAAAASLTNLRWTGVVEID